MNYSFYLLNIENNQLVIINLIKLTFDFGGMEKRLKLSLKTLYWHDTDGICLDFGEGFGPDTEERKGRYWYFLNTLLSAESSQ